VICLFLTRPETGFTDKVTERTECTSSRGRSSSKGSGKSLRRWRGVRTCQSRGSIFGSSFYSNPVRAAYTTSLETQISSLRDELANLYKTQGQNAQRLLSMNETLREKEELSRIDAENLRKAKEDITVLRKKVEQHGELMAEKDRTVQVRLLYILPQICMNRVCRSFMMK
jgi:DNA-directed RNA polymerase subunit F